MCRSWLSEKWSLSDLLFSYKFATGCCHTLRGLLLSSSRDAPKGLQFLMGQDHAISLLPTKQQASRCMPSLSTVRSLFNFWISSDCILWPGAYQWESGFVQLRLHHKDHCVCSNHPVIWPVVRLSSVVGAEFSDCICRLRCVVIANKPWHFHGDCCSLGVPLTVLL